MGLPEKNIVKLQHVTVFDKIQNFLKDKESQNTRDAYEKDIRDFFLYTRNKNIEFLIDEDILFTHTEVVEYKNALREGYSGSTVNRKIASVKSLFKFIARDDDRIRVEMFDVGRVKEKTQGSGVLTWEQVQEMISLVRYTRDGLQKALLIELATRTSIRLEAITHIKWSDIVQQGDYWIVTVYDKGEKLDEKPISQEFYDRLCKIKCDREQVFSISARTFQRAVKEASEKMGLDSDNISFHSLKKVGINWVIDTTGDITKAAQQGNHSNIQTTWKHYKDKNRDWGSMAGVTMGSDIDVSQLKDLSQEELLELIKSLSPTQQLNLINKAKATH